MLLGRVILGSDLVVLLLGSRTGFQQLLHTIFLYLEVGQGDFSSLVLGLVHTHQIRTFGHMITHLTIDMLYSSRQGRRYILGKIPLEVCRNGYLALYLTRLENGSAYLLYAFFLLRSGCFLTATAYERKGCEDKKNVLFHIIVFSIFQYLEIIYSKTLRVQPAH